MDWLYKISVTCFAASYLVVLVLEISRVFFNATLRNVVRTGFALAGLFAHTVYLVCQGKLEFATNGIWLTSWMAWCLTAAWLLAAAYLWVSLKRPDSVFGLFLMPSVLALISAGLLLSGAEPFSVNEAKTGWNRVHGLSLLLGTTSVALGFMFGMIYLIQANRLKRKKPPSRLFRLPSLEWLQRCSERSLIVSTLLLAMGLVSGIVVNLVNQQPLPGADRAAGTIAWTDPVVWSSAILFCWLLTISIFNASYRPARQGRKVAYLVVGSFLFLVLELTIVWMAGHAARSQAAPAAARAMVFPVQPDNPFASPSLVLTSIQSAEVAP